MMIRKVLTVVAVTAITMAGVITANKPVHAQSQPFHVHQGLRCGVLVEHYSCGGLGPEYNCAPYDYPNTLNRFKCFHATN